MLLLAIHKFKFFISVYLKNGQLRLELPIHLSYHLNTVLLLPEYGHPPSEDAVLHPLNP